MELNPPLTVIFTHSNTVRDRKKPYTIYEIEVRSSSTITWVVYKRYSEFFALHSKVSKERIKADNGSTVQLPPLPPKRMTRSLAAEFVEKRKRELEEYLIGVVRIPELARNATLLDFLEIPESVRSLLVGRGGSAADLSSRKSGLLDRDLANVPYEEQRVAGLIAELAQDRSSQKVSAIKRFEEWFFTNKPRLSPQCITDLFRGRNGKGGLLQTCGRFRYSHVASRAALFLVCRLLDVEQNRDAELFIDQFTSLDLRTLKLMSLGLHIVSGRGTRLGAFQILSILRNAEEQRPVAARRSQMELQGGLHGFNTEHEILENTWARQEYIRWAERRSGRSSVLNVSGVEAESRRKKPPSIHELGPRAIIKRSIADVLSIVNNDSDDWKPIGSIGIASPALEWRHLQGLGRLEEQQQRQSFHRCQTLFRGHRSPQMASSTVATAAAAVAPEEVIVNAPPSSYSALSAALDSVADQSSNAASESSSGPGASPPVSPSMRASAICRILQPTHASAGEQGFGGWLPREQDDSRAEAPELLASAELPPVVHLQAPIRIFFRNDPFGHRTLLRIRCQLPYSVAEVARYLRRVRRQLDWDVKLQQIERVCTLDESTDVVHCVYRASGSPFNLRHLVLLRHEADIEGGGKLLVYRTVEHPDVDRREQKHLQDNRCTLLPSGCILQPFYADDHSPYPATSAPFDAADAFSEAKKKKEKTTKRKKKKDDDDESRSPRRRRHASEQQSESGGVSGAASLAEFGGSVPAAVEYCWLTIMAQLDRESVLIVAPDLLGESMELEQSIHNLAAGLACEYGWRTFPPGMILS